MEFKPEEKYGFKLKSGKYTSAKTVKNKFGPRDLTIRELGKMMKGARGMVKVGEAKPITDDMVDSFWQRVQSC
eukprot:CAMPEP_0205806202 /NCGR_PEP_ID=MMETSP0205-20121125/9650_1 /ASSEMBLY_ACC=CAM_ASM_000278 /TAXON_ID=36767 /ORGANISM="Euplotes focardii, Strain TN1" /LENGTH=72 /DNA_ID=CAMNT_0053078633 /DNA_START=298 /DNA_END=516 /DNA_ORIENTATION=-